MNFLTSRGKKNFLKEEDIDFIMANTDFKRDQVIAFYNEFIKKCPNNKLDRKSFIPFYKALIPGDHPDENKFCENVFQAFDTDNNGYIDFGEFLIAFWIRAKGSLKEKLTWLYNVYDVDKNGSISTVELYKTLKIVFSIKNINEDAYEKAKEIIQKIDRNGDGKLSKEEFIAGLTKDERLRNILSPM